MREKSKTGELGKSGSADGSSGGQHPSRSLSSRARGYGVAAGYEKPYQPKQPKPAAANADEYGPLPHSGYYGAGDSDRPFKRGQAGFSDELLWYPAQYGEETSGYKPPK